MSKLSLQFHALPMEVFDLLHDVLEDESVVAAVASGSPLQFQLLERYRSGGLAESDQLRALIFTLAQPSLKAKSIHDFLRLNPTALILEVGKLSSSGLSESWLSTMTEDGQSLAAWKRIARRIRERTMTGVTALNPKTGATAPAKSHRFTIGAQRAFQHGVAMLPAAGTTILRLPAPALPTPVTRS